MHLTFVAGEPMSSERPPLQRPPQAAPLNVYSEMPASDERPPRRGANPVMLVLGTVVGVLGLSALVLCGGAIMVIFTAAGRMRDSIDEFQDTQAEIRRANEEQNQRAQHAMPNASQPPAPGLPKEPTAELRPELPPQTPSARPSLPKAPAQ
jgi:hypothetical protein